MPSPISAWMVSRGTIALPGYSVFILPWAGVKTDVLSPQRIQDSALLGGGYYNDSTGGQNRFFEVDIWLEAGTYKMALIIKGQTDAGIHNITGINGTQTFDGYINPNTANRYIEVTGITVAAAGLYTLKDTMATKSASSSGYSMLLQSIALIRTGD